MSSNFTAQDVRQTLCAVLALGATLLPVGFLSGWCSNVLGFRQSSRTMQALLSVVLSIAILPAAINLLGHWISLRILGLLCLSLAVICVVILARDKTRRAPEPGRSHLQIACGLLIAWVIICTFSLCDLQLGSRLDASAVSFDQSYRVAFIGSAMRTGVPPANPFFYAGGFAKARYYYYWYVLCAAPGTVFKLQPRHLLDASSVWCGLALASIIPLYLKFFFRETVELSRKSLIGIGLLAVTGLDLLPTALLYLMRHVVNADMEWWNRDEVTSWIDALFWVPHHVAALIACLIGFLILFSLERPARLRASIGAIAVAAFAFASAAGMSIYVTMAFVFFVAVWMARLTVKGHWRALLNLGLAGILAGIVSLPYLLELRGKGSTVSGGPPARIGFREQDFFSHTTLHGPGFVLTVIVAIAVCYFIEFGFFGLIACRQAVKDWPQRKSLSEERIAAWYMAGSSLLFATFLRSAVIANNDLGWRSIMFAQFIFLLWGALALAARRKHADLPAGHRSRYSAEFKFLAVVTLVLGLCASIYQVGMLRLFAVMADHGKITESLPWQAAPQLDGTSNYQLRKAFEVLSKQLPSNAIVQANPDSSYLHNLLFYSNYQAVDGIGPDCGTEYGGSLPSCLNTQDQLRILYGSPGKLAPEKIDATCEALSINDLVVLASDSIWSQPESWVWTRQPILANTFVRVFACGTRPANSQAQAATP